MPLDLDPTQLDRYSRHVIMDEVGPEGQAALLSASVLVVGAGGLGSPVLQYLAAAGVGRLGIADGDVVERSNLQRQTIHGVEDLDRPKVDSAADFVAGLNPDVDVETHPEVTAENAGSLVADYDFVVDCSDNFRTRFLLNDACVLADRPLSNGAVYRFEGQVTTFSREGPCYRCLFPEAPEPGTVPNCAEVGILGVLPGVVGGIQATEVVKHLVGVGESLDGRLLVYDAAGMAFEEVPIRRDPDCPVCGEDPAIQSVAEVEYADTCSLAPDGRSRFPLPRRHPPNPTPTFDAGPNRRTMVEADPRDRDPPRNEAIDVLPDGDEDVDEDCSVVDDYLRSVLAREDVAFADRVVEFDDRETFEATRARARRLRGAAVVAVTDGDRLLLVENGWMDGYGLPGGGVEPGEDWETAAVREVREETGVEVELDRPLAVHGGVNECGDDRFRGIYGVKYLAHPNGDPAVADDPGLDDEEIEAAGWFESMPDRANDPEALRATFERFVGER